MELPSRFTAQSGETAVAFALKGLYKRKVMAKKQQSPQDKPERFESDADRLVHRHLADKNHTITEEELQSIRIGHLSTGETVSEEAPLQSEDKAADRG